MVEHGFAGSSSWHSLGDSSDMRRIVQNHLPDSPRILLGDVGEMVVTARRVKKRLPELRAIRDRTVQRTFDRLGFGYLYRRKKSAIGENYKPARHKYCD